MMDRAIDRQEGATAVEYAIMAALIAAVIVLVVFALGAQTCETFDDTSQVMADASIGTAAQAC